MSLIKVLLGIWHALLATAEITTIKLHLQSNGIIHTHTPHLYHSSNVPDTHSGVTPFVSRLGINRSDCLVPMGFRVRSVLQDIF